ncbi:histidine-specific methyltransferase, partial [Podospora aff. communis PSN243]
IINGLSRPIHEKSLPPLLLWDKKGQKLFMDVVNSPSYYPYSTETKLLSQHTREIVSTIASSAPDILIEFGSPSQHKTIHFLFFLDSQLTKPMTYYALDVDPDELERSLLQVRKSLKLRNITVRGLLGTYDDGMRWLARDEMKGLRTAFLWLGSSICNFDKREAGELLGSFLRATGSKNFCGILMAVDGCQDVERLSGAYDVPEGHTKRWILHSLDAARELLVKDCPNASEIGRFFDKETWSLDVRCDGAGDFRYQTYVSPSVALDVVLRGQTIHLDAHERIRIITSGKWAADEVLEICEGQGLRISKMWQSDGPDYGIYWIQARE